MVILYKKIFVVVIFRLQFIELVKQGPNRQMEALCYSRNLAPFADSHSKGNGFSISVLCII